MHGGMYSGSAIRKNEPPNYLAGVDWGVVVDQPNCSHRSRILDHWKFESGFMCPVKRTKVPRAV